MANIIVTSTGKEFYEVDSAVASVLLEAFPESFKRIVPKSAAPEAAVAVQFSVQHAIGTRVPYIHIHCPKCQRTTDIVNPSVNFAPGHGMLLDEQLCKKKSPVVWAREAVQSVDGRLCVHAGGKASRVPEHIVRAFIAEFEK